MGFNKDNKKTYHLVNSSYSDGRDFFINQGQLKNPDKPNAFGDAIGHNCKAFIAYGHYPFVDAVKYCYKTEIDKKGVYLQGYRHPVCFDLEKNTMSRDHILYGLILMKLTGEKEFLSNMGENLRWKISDKYSFTIESWFWMKGISDDKLYNKIMMFLYYLIEIPLSLIYTLWNKAIFKLGGFKKESTQDDFVLNYDISKRKKKFRKLIYPTYALQQKAYLMYATKNSFCKWLLKKICLLGVDKQNFLLRIMFGGKVKESDVYSYKPMYGGRWGTSLNDLNDRFLKIIKNEDYKKENNIDKDILIKMYDEFK